MVILIDTREQSKLQFKHSNITGTIVRKLNVGDYGVQFKDGHIPNIFFERKSIGDLFGTMGKGYKRFKKEIERAHESKSTLIIIVEGSVTKVLGGYKHSKMSGVSVITKLFTLWIRYGVMPVFSKDREEMARYIAEFYSACGREYILKKKVDS